MMIAGDGHATRPQSLDIVAWACDRSQRISDAPAECPEGAELTVRVTFPDCWNGRDTDSEDHKAHVAYSGTEGCPSTHPVAMPVLTFVVHYPVTGSVEGLGLSPGSLLNGHADFVNTWEPEALRREIDHCLKKGLVCSSPGGTGGSPRSSEVRGRLGFAPRSRAIRQPSASATAPPSTRERSPRSPGGATWCGSRSS